jgi:O-antigen/teichoic acid export membrane protein
VTPSSTLRERYPFLVNSGYATLTAGSAVLLLGLLTLAGRFLTASDYGRFSYALALTTIIETLMDVGLTQVTTRTVARNTNGAPRFFQHVLGLKLIWVASGLTLLLILAPILRSDAGLVRLCYLMGISSAVRSYLLTTRGLLQGLHRFDIEAVIVVCDRLLLLLSGAVVLLAGHGLIGLALAFVGSRLTMLVVVPFLLRPLVGSVRPRFDRTAWRDLQAAALPLGFFMIAVNMYSYIDTVILGLMRTDAEVGWYSASYRVYEGLTYLPSVLAAVLIPRLSHQYVHDPRSFRKQLVQAVVLSMALGVVLGLGAMFAAGSIMTLVFGAAYQPGIRSLQILGAGSVFVFGTWILYAAAIASNLDRRLLVTTLLGLTVNVLVNVALIPRFGIRGAAWATVIAEALTFVVLASQISARLRSNQAGER